MTDSTRGIGTLAPILVTILWIGLAVSCIESIVGAAELAGSSLPGFSKATSLFQSIVIVALVLLIVTYFIFGRWIWLASKNLWDRDIQGLEFSPASCIWWYAVPVANLFKPFQAMREIWNASLGEDGAFAADTPDTLRYWWGFWIGSAMLGNLSYRLPEPGSTTMLVLSAILDIALYWFAIKLVRTITKAQTSGITGLAEIFS